MKNNIVERYKEKIKEIYKFQDDEEIAHRLRDNIYRDLVEELGYKELADLLEKAEEDIGFWYA
jgi:chromatin segregation and condensation protein Rec8/ScpA/Scc1 (kleisin family)